MIATRKSSLVVPPAKKNTPPAPDVNLDSPDAIHFMKHGDQTPPISDQSPEGFDTLAPTGDVKTHPDRPWEGKNPLVVKPYLLRLSEPLHTMLEFLGDTTYKESMHSIAQKAIQDSVIARLIGRGVPEEQIRAFLPK